VPVVRAFLELDSEISLKVKSAGTIILGKEVNNDDLFVVFVSCFWGVGIERISLSLVDVSLTGPRLKSRGAELDRAGL
jgi:hypothetical protein